MPVCQIEILDEVNVRLSRLSPNVLTKLSKLLTYFVPNYQFMKAYKAGRWDGKIRFLHRNGRTYLNLLDQLLPVIAENGFDVEIVDNRRPFDFRPTLIDEDFFEGINIGEFKGILEPHQVEAVNALLSNGGGIIEAATGAGKTIITAALARSYMDAGKVLIIVPRIDLAMKTKYVIEQCKMECGIVFEEIKDPKHITVTTWQSLALMPELCNDVACIMVDECHEAKATVLNEVLTGPAKNVPVRIGMTGTMPEADVSRVQIIACLGQIVYTIAAYDLQQRGFLAECHINVMLMKDRANLQYQLAVEDILTYKEEQDWKMTNLIRLEYIAAMITELAKSGNTLVLVNYKQLGKALENLVEGSIFLSGEDRGSVRNRVYNEINQGNNGCLIGTFGIASVGIDIPRIFNLVVIDAGKDLIRVLQSIGRGLRKASDKHAVEVFDISSDAHYSSRHVKERIRIYRSRKYQFSVTEVDYYADSVQF